MLTHEYFTLRLIRLKSSEDWSFKRDGLCVLFPKGGEGKYVSATGSERLVTGDVLVVNNTSAGRLRSANAADLVFWCFSLRLDHLYPLFAGTEISLLETVADSFSSPKLYAADQPLAKQCHRLIEDTPPQFNLDHRSQLLRVASVILTEEFKNAHEQRVGALGAEAHMIQIFEQITAEELLTVSVGDLAAKFSCSRRHLNRLFHQYFGFSVAALRMEMRLLKAVSILRDANTKIIHVAEQCGFNHLGLFNTCFKRRFGVSPGAWRKQSAMGNEVNPEPDAELSTCPLHTKGLCPWTGGPDRSLSPASPLLQAGIGRGLPGMKFEPKSMAVPSQNGGGKSNNGH